MNLHDAEILRKLNDYLARRRPPQVLSDEKLRADQIGVYAKIIRSKAPSGDQFRDWWGRFLDALAESSETWGWPAERDVVSAARAASGSHVGRRSVTEIDSVSVNLARLNASEPIGVSWLWGSDALRLVAAGADPLTMRQRRIAYAQNLVSIYGEDSTRRRLRELKEKHEFAERALSDFQHGRQVRKSGIPNKSIDFGDLII